MAMKVGSVSKKMLSVVAVVVALAFVVGLYANYLMSSTVVNRSNYAVSDTYPYGECLGSCPQHNFVFSADVVTVAVVHLDRLVYLESTSNLITNEGQNVISRQVACGAGGAPACADGGVYIALSNSTAAPAATDTTCPLELTTNGLGRVLGNYTQRSSGSDNYTITAKFTYKTSAYSTTISKVCMFDASTAGDLFAETQLTPPAVVSATGDQVTITWTFVH
jgi:hypothetical protein